MTQYMIQSSPLYHAAGVFKYIMEAILPFDVSMAARLLDDLGIPQEACVAIMDGDFFWIVEEDGETVRLVTYH